MNSVLDVDARGLAQLLGAIGLGVALLLVVAILVPLFVVGSLFHTGTELLPRTLPQLPALLPAAAPGSTHTPLPRRQSGVVETAQHYLGTRYVFGGTNPAIGLDCSGLVQLVFRQLGVGLPRTAQQQYNATLRVTRDQLQPGDLVFFSHTYADPYDWITHVGIYVGNGQQINAPTEGQVVSVQPVFSGFWGAHFVSGGRVAQ